MPAAGGVGIRFKSSSVGAKPVSEMLIWKWGLVGVQSVRLLQPEFMDCFPTVSHLSSYRFLACNWDITTSSELL